MIKQGYLKTTKRLQVKRHDNLEIRRFGFFPQDSGLADLVEQVVVLVGKISNAVIEWTRVLGLTLPAAGHVKPKH